ncbi:MAG TPA: hypothetical protein VG013_19845 [Gemmataceae bacterium]|jgi:hypothetical protein|nr:hypothetical protein [Gemmataceae bacterium]
MAMSTPARTHWKHLEARPKSFYRQLFLRGTHTTARSLYGWYMSEEEPMTPEQLAAEFSLPVEAVLEAIAYCQANPPEIQQDARREEALMDATGMTDPGYKFRPTPKVISTEERARILNS